MILAVDVGNTNIVLGCIENGRILNVRRMATDASRTEYEYAVMLKQILSFGDISCEGFEGAILSSVVPPLTATIKSAVCLLTGITPLVVGAGIKTGLDIRIDNPAQLGGDLAVGAVAALSIYGPPLIVVDMGTATTLTVVDKNSHLVGVAIMPGVSLSLGALVRGTSQLPRVPLEAPERSIGTNTIDSMKSGAVFGTAAMLDGMIERMEAELGTPVKVVATGGLAHSIVPHCRREIVCEEDLLLLGLSIIYTKNQKTK